MHRLIGEVLLWRVSVKALFCCSSLGSLSHRILLLRFVIEQVSQLIVAIVSLYI